MCISNEFYLTVYLQCVQIVLLQFFPTGVYANELLKSKSNEDKNIPVEETYSWEHNPDYGSENTIDEKANDPSGFPIQSQERHSVRKESNEEYSPASYDRKEHFRVQKETLRPTDLPPDRFEVEKRNLKISTIGFYEKQTLHDIHGGNQNTPKAGLSSIGPLHKYQGQKKKNVPGKSIHLGGNLEKVTGKQIYRDHKQQIPHEIQNGNTVNIPRSDKREEKYNFDRTNENKLKKRKHENFSTDNSKPNPTLRFEEKRTNENTDHHKRLSSKKPDLDKLKNKKFNNEQPYDKTQNYNTNLNYEQNVPLKKARHVKKSPKPKWGTLMFSAPTQFYSDENNGDKKKLEKDMTKTFRNDILKTTHKGKHHVINDNQSNIRAKDKYKIKSRDEGHNIEKEHNHDQEELSQSRNVRTHQENHKTQKGRGHSQQVAKQDKHKKSEEIDKNILREKPKIHKSTSYSRVTQGFKYNKKVVNANKIRDKQKSQSYESVEMIDSSDSDLQNNEKAATQIHRSTIGKRSRLKTAQIETEVLKPFSIARQLDYLREKLSDYATIEQEVIGKTVEYNDIVLWKIKERPEDSQTASAFFRSSKKKIKYADEPPEKKIILIVHGLSVMGWHNLDCLNKIKRFETLLGYYMENLDCYDIYLIPMANPDGVAKALGTQPWNKNVSPQNACPGVHLDRNFDVEWNKNASKESSCRASYPGPAPFSEKETKAIRELFKNLSHKMVAYIHVHAGSHDSTVFKGDAVLYPKGYSDDSSDDDRYIDLKGDIEEAMRNTSLNVVSVTVDTLYNWYGLTTGASVDYASKVYGIPYTMELVMQLYEDDTQVANEDMREQNAALTEIWQVVIDVILDSIYRRVIKPDEQ